MSIEDTFPVRAARGILHGVIQGGSQFLSLMTFGWWNPLRDPPALPFLSTSARAGRGVEQGIWIWKMVAPMIDFAFRAPFLDGEDDHCGRSWRGYERNRGMGSNEILGVAMMTGMALAFGGFLLFAR